MPDNKIQFVLQGRTGIAARLKILLFNQNNVASTIDTVAENSTYPGFFSATMAGEAGRYTATVLLDSLPIYSRDGFFVWNGTEFGSSSGGLDAAGVREAIGLESANLDSQLGAIDNYLDTEVAAIIASVVNLPSDPADQSAVVDAIAAAISGLSSGGGGLGPEDVARLERIEQQLTADTRKGATRYQRLLPGTSTVILDKDVSYHPETGFTLTEHEEPPP